MDKSSSWNIPIDEQRRAWNEWNAAAREAHLGPASQRQAQVIEQWVAMLGREDLRMIDIGCGVGWTCGLLSKYGPMVGIDLADEVIERARSRYPGVQFIAGDFFEAALSPRSFDVAVALEVLSHVADQERFLDRVAALVKPSGWLMVATQNRPVLEKWSKIEAPDPGQLRHWVDARRLRELLSVHFEDIEITSVLPVGDQGVLRLVNSVKLNRLVEAVVAPERIERAKERALLGHTLLARARRRVAQ